MSDLRHYNRTFLSEFIDLYRQNRCLWNTKSRDYFDRNLKAKAYEKLVEKMKEVEPKADRRMVVKKINSIRSTYRREVKKRDENAERSHLWYFEKLRFLQGEDIDETQTQSNAKIDHQIAEDGHSNDDKFDFLAKSWALTIRDLNRDQQIFAQKLVNDVLFQAQIGNLSVRSNLVTVQEEQEHRQSHQQEVCFVHSGSEGVVATYLTPFNI